MYVTRSRQSRRISSIPLKNPTDNPAAYAEIGIDHFILSGYPHLEEAYWFGEGVLPILERRGLWKHPGGRNNAGAATGIPFSGSPTR